MDDHVHLTPDESHQPTPEELPYRQMTAALLRRTMTRRHWMARVAMFGTGLMAPVLLKLGAPATVFADSYCNQFSGGCSCSGGIPIYGCSPDGSHCGSCTCTCPCGGCGGCCCCWWCSSTDWCCCITQYPSFVMCNDGTHACACPQC